MGEQERPEPQHRGLEDVFGDVLPDVTRDEVGDDPGDPTGDPGRDEWLRTNRPPHHDEHG